LAEPESLLTHIGPGTPPNVAAALRLIEDARQQMQQGAYDAALDRLERAVAIDPTNAYGYYFLARVHFLKKNYDQAIAFASRAASLSTRADRLSLGRIRSLQGAVFEEVGRYPDARKAYQQALEADPDNLSAQVGLTRLSAGE
jgi:tetratricopeptide (TPR) repeat protein